MKRGFAMLALGLAALGIQGGLAMVVPRALCPDLGLLVVIAMGLHMQAATTGLFISFALGLAADLLSGSIFGAHALLRVLAFATTALARRQMDLRGATTLAPFVGVMTILYAVGVFSLIGFFGVADQGSHWTGVGGLFPHAIVNALVASPVSKILLGVCRWVEGEESRRGLEIDARRSTP